MSDPRRPHGTPAALRPALPEQRIEDGGLVTTPRAAGLAEELVRLCVYLPDEIAATIPTLLGRDAEAVHDLCTRAELLHEEHWAARVLASASPLAALGRFPHLAGHHRLISAEMAAVTAAGVSPHEAVVIGSGALPLTGIGLALEHGISCTVVEQDAARAAQSAAVLEALGMAGAVAGRVGGGASDLPALAGAAMVVLTGLVGGDAADRAQSAAGVAARMRPEALLLVRTAAGVRALLRPALTAEVACAAAPGLLEPVTEIRPDGEVAGSVLVLRRTGRDAPAA